MSKHDKFILTPITSVLEEAVVASYGIGKGIESYSISDYIMQSLFLKMTGFQEQKMKCISWEMATNNYNYRRRLLSNDDNLGEHSSYKAKNTLFMKFQEVIESLKNDTGVFDVFFSSKKKEELRNETVDEILMIFTNSNLAIWQEKAFDYFLKQGKTSVISESQFLPSKQKNQKNYQLFQTALKEKYEVLYKQRNRLAHNVNSYQDNLPTLKALQAENEESRNYFVWFAIIVLIDKIFMELYKIYQLALDEDIY
ncbi:TPA: hypothetical protein ACGOTT_000904 [Streptococcus suis]|nr:hypothetical protein [Streptococcus suis]